MFTEPGQFFAASADYEIEQSIRFNDDDSAYLEWSGYSGSPTSGTDCTFSFWVKRCRLGATQVCIYGGDASGSTYEMIRFDSDDQFRVAQASSAYDLTTTQVFRDVAAWSHFVVAFDTDDSTAADRIKMYHNGSRITDFSVQTNPSSGYVTNLNTGGSGEAIQIGREGGNSQFLDGYMAEIVFIDGQALTPSSFGETNNDGVWIPKNPSSLTFGTNGYYLKGQDSSALGDDTSGNGNDFTSSGLAAADQVTDSPTNNWCVWNPIDTSFNDNTTSDGNLKITTASPGYTRFQLGTIGVTSGKWEWKWTPTDSLSDGGIGVDDGTSQAATGASSGALSSQSANGVIYRSGGTKLVNGSATSYGDSFAADDVIRVQLDLDSGTKTIEFFKNDSSQGTINLNDNVTYFPAQFSADAGLVTVADFGQGGFTPASGFDALNANNLSDPTIADPSAHFQTTLYAGNGSTQSITNGGNSDLQPDLIWIKNRSAADSHVLTDSVRGATKILATDSTGAESTDADTVTAFASDGFALGDDDKVNTSSENYVAWQWKADSAWSEDATGNIVASSGRRNTTAGFSIASWTHQTSGNYAIRHGLSTTPEFFMTKSRDNTVNWDCWHKDLADTAKRLLMTTAAESTAYWVDASDSADGSGSYGDISSGESPVTSSLFGFQHDNFSATDDVVGYFWHGVENFSKFGSYTGNGNADGPFIYTGFKPAFLMYKVISTTDSWEMYDDARQGFNVHGTQLKANLSNAETDDTRVDILSNGFKPRSNNTAVNAAQSYIFAAFAENPFKTATAR